MGSSSALSLDGFVSALLRYLVEETAAVGGMALISRRQMVARFAAQRQTPLQDPPPAMIEEALSGKLVAAGPHLCTPVMLGGKTVAALCVELPPGQSFDLSHVSRLLSHAGQGTLAWTKPPLERDSAADSLPPLHVLVVEDNEVNRKVAKAFLEHAGHAVAICADGAQAVAAVVQGDFDVVLMDIRMPVMDGVEATRQIRALPDRRRATLPILALTANFTSDEVESYVAAGINAIIRKPLRLGDIEQALAPFFDLPDDETVDIAEPSPSSPLALTLSPSPSPSPTAPPVLDPQRVALLAEALDPQRLAELFQAARASIAESRIELEDSWRRKQSDTAAKAAHRLAGVAANFGCTALGDLARQIEQDCKAGGDGTSHAQALSQLAEATLDALDHRD